MTITARTVSHVTTLIAGTLALTLALLLPTGYFAISYQYLLGRLDTDAETSDAGVVKKLSGWLMPRSGASESGTLKLTGGIILPGNAGMRTSSGTLKLKHLSFRADTNNDKE